MPALTIERVTANVPPSFYYNGLMAAVVHVPAMPAHPTFLIEYISIVYHYLAKSVLGMISFGGLLYLKFQSRDFSF